MTEGLAIELACAQMRELDVNKFMLRYRHFRVDRLSKKTVRGENHYYYLLESPAHAKITSKAGIYDMSDTGVNEQQHIHRGIIKIENTGQDTLDLKFLQVIPKLK